MFGSWQGSSLLFSTPSKNNFGQTKTSGMFSERDKQTDGEKFYVRQSRSVVGSTLSEPSSLTRPHKRALLQFQFTLP
jgi:hypothetical protein